jgi:hypothetical protein
VAVAASTAAGSARFSTLVVLLPDERAGLFVPYNTPFDAFETLSAFMDHYFPAPESEEPRTAAGPAP